MEKLKFTVSALLVIGIGVASTTASAQNISSASSGSAMSLPPSNPVPSIGEFATENDCLDSVPSLYKSNRVAITYEVPFQSDVCEGPDVKGCFSPEYNCTRFTCALRTRKFYSCAKTTSGKWVSYVTQLLKTSSGSLTYDNVNAGQAQFCGDVFFEKSHTDSRFEICPDTGKSMLMSLYTASGGAFQQRTSTDSASGDTGSQVYPLMRRQTTCIRNIANPCIVEAGYTCTDASNPTPREVVWNCK
jgi:hypothetical protein